jgi:hypothetical protein
MVGEICQNTGEKSMKFYDALTDFIFTEQKPEKADAIFVPGGLYGEIAQHAAELYQQGIKSEVLREEPFVTAQDELDYKVYLMIYKWQGKNRGVNVRRIN